MATRAQTISTKISKSSSAVNSRRLIYSCLIWLLTVCMIALFCQSAMGQSQTKAALNNIYNAVNKKWRVIPLRPGATPKEVAQHRRDFGAASKEIRAANKRARDTLANGGNVSTLTPFFLGHVYPMMTVKDEVVTSNLGEMRNDYLKDYLGPKVTGKARADLITLTVTNMQKIYSSAANDPVNRVSAVYLMGALDDAPAIRSVGGTGGQTPVPSKAALVGLAQILLSKDANVPDFLKVAAISGIHRHLKIDSLAGGGLIPNDQKRFLNQKALELLNANQETDVAYWFKRRSMQILGFIGDPASADAAIGILKSDAGLWLKLDAVEALNKIQTRSLGAPKNLEVAVAVSDFVTQAIGDEAKTIQSTVDEIVFNGILQQNVDLLANPVDYQSQTEEGSGGSGRRGDRGGAFGGGLSAAGDEDDRPQFELPGYHLNLARRRIKSLAYYCSQTLGGEDGNLGLRQHIADDGKALVGNIIGELDQLLDDSNAGIIDLDNPPKELELGEEPPGTATHQLTELCKNSSKRMAKHLRKHRGEPDPIEGSDTRNAPGSGTTNAPGSGTTSAPGSGTTNAPGSGTTNAPGSDTTNAPPGSGATAPGSGTTTNPLGDPADPLAPAN